MTTTIHILSENLANKIAAGEVVERPASVVKELIENAIDAQAKKITIALHGSGKKRITVSDDGIGMGYNDALLAFERHATSKIKDDHDLTAISTLGFRGEAIPSIASISQFTLTTSSGATGTQIFSSGGTIKQVKEIAYPQGTCIEVNNLFFNTPARKKFLKSDATELSHITRIVLKQSLSRPDIYFILSNNNRTVLDTPSVTAGIEHKIGTLFGHELLKDLMKVSSTDKGMELSGYISQPSTTRSNRENQYLFINNRYIKDRVIYHAIQQAYRRIVPANQYPFIFLYLTINPQMVDVNVHPSKLEVRFVRQDDVHRFVVGALSTHLYQNSDMKDSPSDNPSFEQKNTQYILNKKVPQPAKAQLAQMLFDNNSTDSWQKRDEEKTSFSPTLLAPSLTEKFRPLGQINNSFIALEGREGIVLIDQHTAHERLLYESMIAEVARSKIIVQQLLVPIQIEVNPHEAHILNKNLKTIGKLGLEIEPFGDTIFLLRSVPALLTGKDCKKVIFDIVDTLSKHEKFLSYEEIVEKIVTTMACHAAVKANQYLEKKEIEHLLASLSKTTLPKTCPHGRPIALLIDIKEIERKFKR